MDWQKDWKVAKYRRRRNNNFLMKHCKLNYPLTTAQLLKFPYYFRCLHSEHQQYHHRTDQSASMRFYSHYFEIVIAMHSSVSHGILKPDYTITITQVKITPNSVQYCCVVPSSTLRTLSKTDLLTMHFRRQLNHRLYCQLF